MLCVLRRGERNVGIENLFYELLQMVDEFFPIVGNVHDGLLIEQQCRVVVIPCSVLDKEQGRTDGERRRIERVAVAQYERIENGLQIIIGVVFDFLRVKNVVYAFYFHVGVAAGFVIDDTDARAAFSLYLVDTVDVPKQIYLLFPAGSIDVKSFFYRLFLSVTVF